MFNFSSRSFFLLYHRVGNFTENFLMLFQKIKFYSNLVLFEKSFHE